VNYATIQVRKLTPVIGAEITGVDLSQPMGNQVFQEVHDALMENLVVFFRDQQVDHAKQMAFGRRFGELHVHPAAPSVPGHPEVMIIHADANSKFVNGESWHSDVSCEDEPPMGSILHLETMPDVGGDTMFANMYAACEALSAPMRSLLAGLTAIHDGEKLYRGRYTNNDAGRVYPRAEHPVIRTHPVTGRQALFVNSFFTTRIVQLRPDESDALLAFLFRHIETPEFACRFRWQPNSVAFWDNRSAQHHALWDYFPHTRHGYRVTVKGDRPFYRAGK
jgi:taurine dioxygenase